MKNLFLLSIVGVALSSILRAQTNKISASTISDKKQTQQISSDVKEQYINNQDYLSTSSLKDYKSFYGDSLKGFDEFGLKADLINRGVYGTEYINYMNSLKRQYINSKYKIGGYQLTKLPGSTTPNASQSGNSKTIGNGNNMINTAPCVNEDFEASTAGSYAGASNSLAITGWTIQSGLNNTTIYAPNTSYGAACNASPIPVWSPGSPEVWIVPTPIVGNSSLSPFSIDAVSIPNSPLGGTNVIRLNDVSPTGLMTRISTTFPVTQANTLFQFAYAGSWDGVHDCCGQPAFRIDMYDCTGAALACSNISLTPSGAQCTSGVGGYSVTNGVSWTNWVVRYVDLTPYIGSCVSIIITNSDCSYTGHHGSAYFDARCGGQQVGSGIPGVPGIIPGPVSFCAGSGVAQISAPLGYATYQWYDPNNNAIPATLGGTLSTLSVTNPVPYSVYTVDLTAASGCQFVATNTVVFTSVSIVGLGSSPSCPGGASGSATVQGFGSGTGYNYSWTNLATNSVVGTTSVVTGLPPGTYSVTISGFGNAGCGSAGATATVATAPPGVINLLKPYCSLEAYLNTNGGTNFQWFNGTTPIAAPLGTAPGYTVTSPTNGGVMTLTYTSAQGCRDSIRYTMVSSPPGAMSILTPQLICPNTTMGKVTINMISASGSPPGQSSYSVFSTGTTAAYNASLYPTSATTFTAGGMAAGNYSVVTFDGSCKYNGNFTIQPLLFNYTLTPFSPTLCPGNSIAAGVNFSTSVAFGEYTYSWSPSTFLAGSNQQSTIISPTAQPGVILNYDYTVVVTPTLVNCPIAKVLTITIVNPPTPTISPIPNLCNTFSPYQVNVNPPGGTFLLSGPNNPIGLNSGIITPSLAILGNNTFVYSISVNTCVSTTTGNYQVSHFNNSALSSSVPPLCVTSNPFNLTNIVQNIGGTWTGSGVSANQFYPGNLLQQFPVNTTTNTFAITYSYPSNPNPATCPSTTTINIAVTKTITPYITPMAEFCTNVTPMSLTVSPSGGTWYNNAAVGNNGLITPNLLVNIPSSVVNYSVITGPCANFASTTILASTFHSAGFTSASLPNMCVTNVPVNLMSIAQSTVGTWIAPSNALSSVINNSFSPQGLATDTYVLTYHTVSSPNAGLCPDTRTISVSVLNPPMPVITQVGPYCNNGSPMQLTVTPNTGSWTGAAYLSTNGVFTPSLCSVGNNPIQYVIGTSTCHTQQTKYVSIEAFVPATIVSKLGDQCNTGSAVNLLPITLSNLGIWSGAGISGTSFNPALTGSGQFVLTYNTASSPSGLCPDQASMAVNVFSLATPVLAKMGPLCNSSAPIQLQVSPVGGVFAGANPGVVSLGGRFSPSSGFIGDNIVNYSITSGPCVAYAQATISVEKYVSADFAKEELLKYCRHDAAVNMNSFVQNPGGVWSGNGIVSASMFDPSKAVVGKNTITYHTHSVPTLSLCPDESTVSIEVRDVPKVTALGTSAKQCAPVEAFFNSPSVVEGEGSWNFGDGSDPIQGFNVSHVYATPGVYNVTFSYADPVGCSARASVANPIYVYEIPTANFSVPEEILISNPDIQLTNLTAGLGNNTYQWRIATTTSVAAEPTDLSPRYEFTKIGKYQITLTATSSKGCKDEITKTVEVKNDFNIFIPTSFTPNFDGLNDYFVPVFTEYGLDLKSFEMEIFDRWGHSLYRTKDVTKGWDGSVQNKGEPLKEEVYIYRIKYKDMDGNTYSKMGHLSLTK